MEKNEKIVPTVEEEQTESGILSEAEESEESAPIIDMATDQPDAKGKRFASFVRDYHVCKAFIELAFRTGKMELIKQVKILLIDGTSVHFKEEVVDND